MTVIYSPSDVQELLGIEKNTLRKYATLLEGRGYQVQRNHRGHRSYLEKDIMVLRKLIEFSKQEGMTMERSVEAAMTWVAEENETITDTEAVPAQNTNPEVVPLQKTDDQVVEQDRNHEKLLEGMEHLEQINVELINHLKEKAIRDARQEEMINQILKYIEKMEQLETARYKAMEEETLKQIAAANQKKWWQWWK